MRETDRIPAGPLAAWVAGLLSACGVEPEGARIAAEVLVDANLSGIDTHGIMRLKPYVGLLRDGYVQGRPVFRCEEKAGALVFEADRGLGQVAGREAAASALDLARTRAVVGMTIRQVGHLGALGHFTARLAEEGMIAVLMQNGPPIMGLPGTSRPGIGNNPIAFSAPVAGGPPIVFDVATSEAAYGKIIEAARAGRPIPEGWALDEAGASTTDAKAALKGILLPSGGHKGVGLSMLVEVLAGGLSGIVPRHAAPGGKGMPAYFGAFLLVANPDLLVGRAAFEAHVADWLGLYKGAGEGARYPGERLAALRAERLRDGIPLAGETVAEMQALGAEFGQPFPGLG